MISLRACTSAALVALAAAPGVLFAQTVTGGQAGTIRDADKPIDLPRAEAPAAIVIERSGADKTVDSSVRFPVSRIVLSGNTVLPSDAFAGILARYEGRELGFGDLRGLTDAITALYARHGYALSFAFIPEQTITDGVVRAAIVEGKVGAVDVKVEGRGLGLSAERIEQAVRARLAHLADGQPLETADLERAVLLIDDLPGMSAKLVVQPSQSLDRASDLIAVITAAPVRGSISFDNRLRPTFGRYSATVSVTGHSLFAFGDALSVASRTGLDFDALYSGEIGYRTPLGKSGLALYANASVARTQAVDGLIETLDFRGREETGTIGLSYSAVRSRSRNLTFDLALNAINTRVSLLGATATRDRVRFISGGARYDWASRGGIGAAVRVGFMQGLDGLGGTSAANPLASRVFAKPDFTALTGGVTLEAPLGPLVLTLAGDGEVTVGGSRLAAVECSYGGAAMGRAYYSGAIGGDHCLRGMAELALPLALNGRGVIAPFAYFDAAQVRQRGTLDVGEVREESASSIGGGLRLHLRNGITASAVVAKPLDRALSSPGRKARGFVSIGMTF